MAKNKIIALTHPFTFKASRNCYTQITNTAQVIHNRQLHSTMIIDQPSSAMTGKHTAALHIFTNVGLQQSYALNPLLFPSVVYAFFQEFHMLFLMLVMCQLYVHNVVLS